MAITSKPALDTIYDLLGQSGGELIRKVLPSSRISIGGYLFAVPEQLANVVLAFAETPKSGGQLASTVIAGELQIYLTLYLAPCKV